MAQRGRGHNRTGNPPVPSQKVSSVPTKTRNAAPQLMLKPATQDLFNTLEDTKAQLRDVNEQNNKYILTIKQYVKKKKENNATIVGLLNSINTFQQQVEAKEKMRCEDREQKMEVLCQEHRRKLASIKVDTDSQLDPESSAKAFEHTTTDDLKNLEIKGEHLDLKREILRLILEQYELVVKSIPEHT